MVLHTGAVFEVRSAIICSGTYLNGRTIVGDKQLVAGLVRKTGHLDLDGGAVPGPHPPDDGSPPAG